MWVFAAIVVSSAVTLLTTIGHDWLPPQYLNHSDVIYSRAVERESVVFALLLVGTILLFRTRKSVLDMWLLVALSAWLIQSLLIMSIKGRFNAGFYFLYVMVIFSHLVVMLALIAESNRLYARLALSTSARNREREARLMSMDAVAAAISHEVGQPLSAVTMNAMAGLNWLTRARPDSEKAIRSLRATIEAGHHTTDVLKSIRAMFTKGTGTETQFSLNCLVRETASALHRELAGEKVSLHLSLDEALPPILADRVQMERVLVNLFTNAIESLAATRGRPRRPRSERSCWTTRTCCSRSAITASASPPRKCRASSTLSSRPSQPVPAWACRCAAISSKSLAGVSGPRPARNMAQPSTCSCAQWSPRNLTRSNRSDDSIVPFGTGGEA
jgi:signal transduction histidine kinase